MSSLWECIGFYVGLFGQSDNGVFYGITWIIQKVLGNCV